MFCLSNFLSHGVFLLLLLLLLLLLVGETLRPASLPLSDSVGSVVFVVHLSFGVEREWEHHTGNENGSIIQSMKCRILTGPERVPYENEP